LRRYTESVFNSMINSQSHLKTRSLLPTAVTKNNYPPIAIAKGRIIVNFCQGVRSDRGIIARMSLIVRKLARSPIL
ncbi:MAG: hypothetical protein ACKPIC_30965, partial [Microcystis panniformis]